EPVVGAVLPAPGEYDFVFDTPSRAAAGRFRFRFWIADTTPPTIRLASLHGTTIVVSILDAGAGVDPLSLDATVDGRSVPRRWTLAAKSSLPVRSSFRLAFRRARSRLRRLSRPNRVSRRGHSAAITITTATASNAMYSQPTGSILSTRRPQPRRLNRSGLCAD